MNPDKPHAFRRRVIMDTRSRWTWGNGVPEALRLYVDDPYKARHTPHSRDEECPEGVKHYPFPDVTCDVCGGSKQLGIHDVEAARFRRKYRGGLPWQTPANVRIWS